MDTTLGYFSTVAPDREDWSSHCTFQALIVSGNVEVYTTKHIYSVCLSFGKIYPRIRFEINMIHV
jgi:hypothetical protein